MFINYNKRTKTLSIDSRQERFKSFRDELNLSATALAQELNISRPTIYSYEKNVDVPRDRLEQLKELYGLNPEWYNFGEGSMILFESPEEAKVINNDRLTELLTEAYNYLPKGKRHLIKAIKQEYLQKDGNVASNEEAMELLKKIHKDIQNRII